MKAIHYYFIFLLLIVSGCSSGYISSSKNVPLFEKKGEAQIEAGVSTNSIFLTGNYAFSEKYALIANGSMSYYYIFGPPNRSCGGELSFFCLDAVPHRSLEAGIGRYNLLPSSKRRLEVFAGTGYGAAHSFWNYQKANYFQGFIQVNTGKRYKQVELGWSLRTAYSGFYSQNRRYRCFSGTCGYFIEHDNFQVFHLEPLFVFRTGGQRLKVSLRSGFNLAFLLSSPTSGLDTNYTILHFSTGLSYRF